MSAYEEAVENLGVLEEIGRYPSKVRSYDVIQSKEAIVITICGNDAVAGSKKLFEKIRSDNEYLRILQMATDHAIQDIIKHITEDLRKNAKAEAEYILGKGEGA